MGRDIEILLQLQNMDPCETNFYIKWFKFYAMKRFAF